MQRYDRLGGLLWVAIGIAICSGRFDLEQGQCPLQVPGSFHWDAGYCFRHWESHFVLPVTIQTLLPKMFIKGRW